ncbi:MAG: phosphoribosylglycinamide formyltransferase [Alphaproteobacteria bacterium]|nr:phosphoribosylglycinamide formyltransferase [Alphaproteobacteria bacterium]
MSKLKVAVLISGRGSNLQALIDAAKAADFPAEIAVVISNNPEAQGLARAAEAGIPAMICDHTYFKGDKDGFEDALASIVEQSGAGLVCLAGFMRILTPRFLNKFKDKVINIHPSLLPAYKGLDTHERVLAAGEKTHGCSVHVVTPAMDEGAVIAQKQVPVLEGDTADTLAARVLTQEHVLYPETVAAIALGHVVIRQGRVERAGSLRHHESAKRESHETTMHHDHHATPVADAEAVARAQAMWNVFTKATVIAGGAVAVLLILLAALVA